MPHGENLSCRKPPKGRVEETLRVDERDQYFIDKRMNKMGFREIHFLCGKNTLNLVKS